MNVIFDVSRTVKMNGNGDCLWESIGGDIIWDSCEVKD